MQTKSGDMRGDVSIPAPVQTQAEMMELIEWAGDLADNLELDIESNPGQAFFWMSRNKVAAIICNLRRMGVVIERK